ncbi:MAG: DUF86 domain-containing protein [Caldilineaceae bacterium]|nr:DUF86 domain-containing protein [Caldilineaceae bacterium]
MDDVVINKIQSIHRCIARVREEYALAGADFDTDFSRQDAAILNITRACEQAIDLANHTIRAGKMGIPQSSSESFELLARQKIISLEIAEQLIRMTGFRNIAVHQCQALNLSIVEAVIVSGLDELLIFCDAIIDHFNHSPADSGGG